MAEGFFLEALMTADQVIAIIKGHYDIDSSRFDVAVQQLIVGERYVKTWFLR